MLNIFNDISVCKTYVVIFVISLISLINVLKIKSYLTKAKSLPHKNYCIYLKKVYGKYIYIFVTFSLKINVIIYIYYTHTFLFSISVF